MGTLQKKKRHEQLFEFAWNIRIITDPDEIANNCNSYFIKILVIHYMNKYMQLVQVMNILEISRILFLYNFTEVSEECIDSISN